MIDLDQLFMRVQEYEKTMSWDNLPNEIKLFADLMLFWYEVGNGGINQYLVNPVGESAIKIPGYLETIGSEILSNKVKSILDLFGDRGPSPKQRKRQKVLNAMTKKQIIIMDTFDEFFNDGPEDIEEYLIEYVMNNDLSSNIPE